MDIKKTIKASLQVKERMLDDEKLISTIETTAMTMVQVFRSSGKVLFCGNGGSAADAQHIAAELSGRFYLDRKPLYAEALHVNASYITAVANDYSFDDIYSRMVEASGKEGDMLIGISTSGNSENVRRAMKVGRNIGMHTVAMTGMDGGKMKTLADMLINVPCNDTPRIQEAHILIGHMLCEMVEEMLFAEQNED